MAAELQLERIPSAWVDAIVVDPNQQTSYDIDFDPAFSGELTADARAHSEARDHTNEMNASKEEFGERQAIARRAYDELFNTHKARPVINYGVGVPDAVAKLIAARNEQHRIYQTIEHGTYGGTLMDGVLFGYARNATAMLDAAYPTLASNLGLMADLKGPPPRTGNSHGGKRVENVDDVVSVGQKILVEIAEIDQRVLENDTRLTETFRIIWTTYRR